MTKLDEMWAALAAYQPQADAAGHGETWARMCSEKTYAAANAANAAARAAAARAADTAAARAANAAANAEAAYYAAGAAYAAAVAAGAANAEAAYYAGAAYADNWAQKAINRIKNITIPAQPPQPAQPAQPAQPELEPITHQYQSWNGIWHDFITKTHYQDTLKDGTWPIRALYTAPPQRKPLTSEQLTEIYTQWELKKGSSWADLMRSVEAAHGIKENT